MKSKETHRGETAPRFEQPSTNPAVPDTLRTVEELGHALDELGRRRGLQGDYLDGFKRDVFDLINHDPSPGTKRDPAAHETERTPEPHTSKRSALKKTA